MKFKISPKDFLIFCLYCLLLLYLCAIAVLNFSSFINEGKFFGLNPYELLSGGALLMVSEDGAGLTGALAEAGISSVVIGSMDFGNDKIVRNGEEIRYLGRPGQDEILKI